MVKDIHDRHGTVSSIFGLYLRDLQKNSLREALKKKDKLGLFAQPLLTPPLPTELGLPYQVQFFSASN